MVKTRSSRKLSFSGYDSGNRFGSNESSPAVVAELRHVLVGPFFGAYRPDRRPQTADAREAGEYITKLPEEEQDEKRWHTAMHVIQAAGPGGPLIFAQWGMLKAVNDPQPVYDALRKGPVWRNN
jgi:hypothetical protein